MTLEQKGYILEGNTYVKNIENYKITLFPTGKDFMRRIILNSNVIDIRKVPFDNIESDKSFLKILQNIDLATQSTPQAAGSYTVKNDEVFLKNKVLNEEVELEALNEIN